MSRQIKINSSLKKSDTVTKDESKENLDKVEVCYWC